MKALNDIPVIKGKRVLVRVDFNVPLNESGEVKNDKRIRIALPTIQYLLDQGVGRLILMTHVGRPKGPDPLLKTDKIARRLSDLLRRPVGKTDDWGERGLPEETIILLENLRFHPGEKSKDPVERDAFGKQLASLADLYVDDAFSNLHRDHASMTSVPKFLPGYAGLTVEKEVSNIQKVLERPEHPFVAVMGGLKADKLAAISFLLEKADHILIGGALAFSLLKIEGYSMGASKVDDEGMEEMGELVKKIQKNPRIHLPVDTVIADRFAEDAKTETVSIDQVKEGWMALDIGPKTIQNYVNFLTRAKTIIWFGPIGVFEMEPFSQGTKAIGKAMTESHALTIVGGGDSASAVESMGYGEKMTLVSTGGGASLKMIEGAAMPGLKALSA
ncbi:phosphoglycerate kinase [Candidatus Peregrinibacteria bacterium]|nr:phosphoglycerate kinase [Candidatus Peregrinibacteria bacterium]